VSPLGSAPRAPTYTGRVLVLTAAMREVGVWAGGVLWAVVVLILTAVMKDVRVRAGGVLVLTPNQATVGQINLSFPPGME
jgi:hypothetical protein